MDKMKFQRDATKVSDISEPEKMDSKSSTSLKALWLQTTRHMLSVILPNLLTGSWILNVVWSFIYLFFVGVLIFQTTETLKDYFSHPVTVVISLETSNDEVIFPTVTICNNNILRKSYVRRISYLQDLAFLDDLIQAAIDAEYEFFEIDKDICGTGLFECRNRKCIPNAWVCNERSECHDGSDESPNVDCRKFPKRDTNQTCTTRYVLCPKETTCAEICNGVNECVMERGYDESEALGCPESCIRSLEATETIQELSSKKFPNSYVNNLECIYTINADIGNVIEIELKNFTVEFQIYCSFDYMKIRNGDERSNSWFKLNGDTKMCGKIDDRNTVFISNSNTVIIYFNTDSMDVETGWLLTYKASNASNISKRSLRENSNEEISEESHETSANDLKGGASFDGINYHDWYMAYMTSVMPDHSDFRALVQFKQAAIIGNGHQAQDFIVQCGFDDQYCSAENFKTHQTSDFGNCFSFNSVKRKQNEIPLKTNNTGTKFGLKLSVFLDNEEYLGISGQSLGATLVISNPYEKPPMDTEPIHLAPGQKTTVSLSQEIVTRRTQPFSECSPSWPDTLKLSKSYRAIDYSVEHCLYLCLQNQIALTCNCSFLTDTAYSDDLEIRQRAALHCDAWETSQKLCVDSVSTAFQATRDLCQCTQHCRRRNLLVDTSSSDWPSAAYAPYLATMLQKFPSIVVKEFVRRTIAQSNGISSDLKSIMQENFARVEIYFKSLDFLKIEETPMYNTAMLFGTLGGNLGLWLGWSIMTLFELFQWVYVCIKVAFVRK